MSQISLKCEHKYNELAVVAEPSKALIAMCMPKVPGLNHILNNGHRYKIIANGHS